MHTVEQVKQYYDTLKNKPDVDKLTYKKIREWKHMAVQKHKEKHNTFFLKKTPLSSVLTSTESVSSTNTTEQTAKDETKVDVIPVSHPTPKPAKKTYHSENLLD